MQVAGLVVVESIGAARCGRIVPRRLVSKRGESKAVGVEKRGGEAPWFVVSTWCRVCVLDVFVVGKLAAMQSATSNMFRSNR